MALSNNPEKRAKQLANLKRSYKGQPSTNPAGRPRSAVRKVIEEMMAAGYLAPSKDDIRQGLILCAFGTEEQIKSIVQDKSRPMALRVLARNVLGDGGFGAIEKILDRVIGKMLDITTDGEKIKQESLIIEVIDRAEQVDRPNEEDENTDNEGLQAD